jgi:L-asparaginase II
VLVQLIRNGIVESVHRGDIVEVDPAGRVMRLIGDPDRIVMLRSTVKPFGLLALLEAGGIEEFDLEPPELALMTGSHSGEDLHVRTLQAVFRRVGLSQALLACGTEDVPIDQLTAMRLARDGERPGPVRHMCSGQHAGLLLLSKLRGWSLEGYWRDDHPVQQAQRDVVGRIFGIDPKRIPTGIDGCGIPTYAVRLADVARAFAMLAAPDEIPADDERFELAPHLAVVRDAMLGHPELVGGTHDRIDTSLVKAVPGRLIGKSGMEALRGVAILAGPRSSGLLAGPSGMALKMEDGGGFERGSWAATVEALHQAGVVHDQALRVLGRYHRPALLDPHGRLGAEAVPEFVLAPVGELIG